MKKTLIGAFFHFYFCIFFFNVKPQFALRFLLLKLLSFAFFDYSAR